MTRSEPPGKRRRPSRSTRCKGAGFLRDVGLALALAFATVAVGQETNPHFDHLGEEQDLSTTRDNGITEDGAGFVWFATGVGLSRFDGYAFRSYQNTPEDASSLPSNYVRSVFTRAKELRDGEDPLSMADVGDHLVLKEGRELGRALGPARGAQAPALA